MDILTYYLKFKFAIDIMAGDLTFDLPRNVSVSVAYSLLDVLFVCILSCDFHSYPCQFVDEGLILSLDLKFRLLFCPVIALAGSQLLNRPCTKSWFFTQSSPLDHSVRSWLASGLPLDSSATNVPVHHPPWTPSAHSSSPFHLVNLLVDRALALIPAFFRPVHVQQSVPLSITPGCFRDNIIFRTLTIELEGHPQYYGSVPTIPTAIQHHLNACSVNDEELFSSPPLGARTHGLPMMTDWKSLSAWCGPLHTDLLCNGE